jgi:hypothetical protein
MSLATATQKCLAQSPLLSGAALDSCVHNLMYP